MKGGGGGREGGCQLGGWCCGLGRVGGWRVKARDTLVLLVLIEVLYCLS